MIEIRAATPDDAAPVAALMTGLGYETGPDDMRTRLRAIAAHGDYASLVARHDGRIVGFLGLTFGLFYERTGTYARIVALSVEARSRRRGVGRALVDAAQAIAQARGAVGCFVNTGLHRADAHAFYERLGFTHKGRSYARAVDPLDSAAGK